MKKKRERKGTEGKKNIEKDKNTSYNIKENKKKCILVFSYIKKLAKHFHQMWRSHRFQQRLISTKKSLISSYLEENIAASSSHLANIKMNKEKLKKLNTYLKRR